MVFLPLIQAEDLGIDAYKQDNRTAKSGLPANYWGTQWQFLLNLIIPYLDF